MRLTKKNNATHYVPREIKETTVTEVSYIPLTRDMLKQLLHHPIKENKHKLVKKRKK